MYSSFPVMWAKRHDLSTSQCRALASPLEHMASHRLHQRTDLSARRHGHDPAQSSPAYPTDRCYLWFPAQPTSPRTPAAPAPGWIPASASRRMWKGKDVGYRLQQEIPRLLRGELHTTRPRAALSPEVTSPPASARLSLREGSSPTLSRRASLPGQAPTPPHRPAGSYLGLRCQDAAEHRQQPRCQPCPRRRAPAATAAAHAAAAAATDGGGGSPRPAAAGTGRRGTHRGSSAAASPPSAVAPAGGGTRLGGGAALTATCPPHRRARPGSPRQAAAAPAPPPPAPAPAAPGPPRAARREM